MSALLCLFIGRIQKQPIYLITLEHMQRLDAHWYLCMYVMYMCRVLCVCPCISACECTCVPVYAGVWEDSLSCYSSVVIHLVFRDYLLAWSSPSELHWITSKHQGLACLCLLKLGYWVTSMCCCAWLTFLPGFCRTELTLSKQAFYCLNHLPSPTPNVVTSISSKTCILSKYQRLCSL